MVTVPALFLADERDTGFPTPGMSDIINAMPALAPQLGFRAERRTLAAAGAI